MRRIGIGVGTASNLTATGNVIKFGLPKIATKIFPGKTWRINTGWNIDALPLNTTLTTVPNPSLMANGVLSIPQTVHSQDSGSELIQQIQNNSPYPI
jgi:hypothetical protein